MSKNTRVLVDMDGVLADVYRQLIHFEYEDTGFERPIASTYGILETEVFPKAYTYINSKDFFLTAPVVEGAQAGLKYLNQKYEVIILSSATEFPLSLTEKELWLQEYFPFITWQQMVFCGRKDIVKGDIMIDDHLKNLSLFQGRKLLFTQPHNVYVADPVYERVDSWKVIMEML